MKIDPWRPFFLLAALLMLAGGPRHPKGTMPEMLAHPDWISAHAFLLAGFIALLVGLILFQRCTPVPDKAKKWVRLAIIATALEAVEMTFHTAAFVDQANLVAGRATPILTIHLALAAIVYPFFGLVMAGFIITTVRARVLGSPWIAWLGILGVAGHAAAAILVIILKIESASGLFAVLLLFAIWLILAALWPLRATAAPLLETAPDNIAADSAT